jgi:hypothetical protein
MRMTELVEAEGWTVESEKENVKGSVGVALPSPFTFHLSRRVTYTAAAAPGT